MSAEGRLKELGIVLPEAVAPNFNYIPTVLTGNLLWVSGQVARGPDGKLITGKVRKFYGSLISFLFLLFSSGGQRVEY